MDKPRQAVEPKKGGLHIVGDKKAEKEIKPQPPKGAK